MPCTLSTKTEPDSRGTSPGMTSFGIRPLLLAAFRGAMTWRPLLLAGSALVLPTLVQSGRLRATPAVEPMLAVDVSTASCPAAPAASGSASARQGRKITVEAGRTDGMATTVAGNCTRTPQHDLRRHRRPDQRQPSCRRSSTTAHHRVARRNGLPLRTIGDHENSGSRQTSCCRSRTAGSIRSTAAQGRIRSTAPISLCSPPAPSRTAGPCSTPPGSRSSAAFTVASSA